MYLLRGTIVRQSAQESGRSNRTIDLLRLHLGDNRRGIDATGVPQVGLGDETGHAGGHIRQRDDGHRAQIDLPGGELQTVGQDSMLGKQKSVRA